VDSDIFGGNEEAALHLLGSLDRARYEPALLHHGGTGIARLIDRAGELGIRTHAVPRVGRRRRLAGLFRLWQAVRAEGPAIFHAHLSWPLACKHGVHAAWLARVPGIVGTAQLYMELRGSPHYPLALRPHRRIIAVSEEVKARYAENLRVPARKLVVVRNGILVPPPNPSADVALRAELLRGRPNYLVFTPARLHPQKGHAVLLAAAAQVPEATFVLAGDGPLRTELEQKARALGVADRCVFLGYRPDVPALLAAADLVVLPSLFEGLPVSVLEAMAAQRPVVATAIGGTDEAITHDQTGLLVPAGDSIALATAIQRVRRDPALAQRLATAGRQRVEREFSSARTASGVMKVYDEIMAEVGAPNAPGI
jgi:glycosyltransferase involved in cell wall biosynthesis